jgi:hypothetical protein
MQIKLNISMDSQMIAPEYSRSYLQIEKPKPLTDSEIEKVITHVLSGKLDKDISNDVYVNFKREMSDWIMNSKLNRISGLDSFNYIDIIIGCTQFIDNIYMQGPVQNMQGDYRYHERLGLVSQTNIDYKTLLPSIPLIISLPFPSTGKVHVDMKLILDACLEKNIPVYIDSAWLGASRDIEFDYSHPAIKSVGISLSKGLGLGWNRIGLRWSTDSVQDSVSIMNNFNMNLKAVVKIGLYFIRYFPSDYLWDKHGKNYYKICNDFNLTPTNTIHLALDTTNPVGVSPLLRYLENIELYENL